MIMERHFFKLSYDYSREDGVFGYECDLRGLDDWSVGSGVLIDHWPADRVVFFLNDGIVLDYVDNIIGWPVVSKRMKEVIYSMTKQVQFLPVKLIDSSTGGEQGEHYAMNILAVHSAMDRDRSQYVEDEENPSHPVIIKLVLKSDIDEALFLLEEQMTYVICSEDLKLALDKEDLKGIALEPISV